MLNVFTIFNQRGEMPPPICYHNTEFVDGKIYILGGMRDVSENEKELQTSVHAFNLDNYEWEMIIPTGEIPQPNKALSCSVSIGSKIYIFGGYTHNDHEQKVFNGMYVFDTENNHWTLLETSGDVPSPRFGASMIAFDYHLYIFGGCQRKSMCFNDIYAFDRMTNKWSKISIKGNMKPSPRLCHSANVIGGNMYVFGGMVTEYGNLVPCNELWKFNFETCEWTDEGSKANGKIPEPRAAMISVSLDPHILIAFGGDVQYPLSNQRSSFYTYDTENHKWKKWEINDLGGLYELPSRLGTTATFDPVNKTIYFYGGMVGKEKSKALYYAIQQPKYKSSKKKAKYDADSPEIISFTTNQKIRNKQKSIFVKKLKNLVNKIKK